MADVPSRPVRIEHLQFVDDALVAVVLDGEGVAIPVRVVCSALGLDTDSQSARLRDHDVLAQGLRIVRIPIDGRMRAVVAILHTHVAFWLASIPPNVVAEAVRPKLIRYQQELVVVLHALYGPNLALASPAAGDPLHVPAVAAIEAQLAVTQRELLTLRTALLDLLRAQHDTDSHVATLETRVEGVADLVSELRQIAKISAAQAEYLQRALKRLAQRVQRKTGTERNMYALLFAQFKMAMGIPRYDALPMQQYDRTLAWLQATAADQLPDDPDALPPMQERLL